MIHLKEDQEEAMKVRSHHKGKQITLRFSVCRLESWNKTNSMNPQQL